MVQNVTTVAEPRKNGAAWVQPTSVLDGLRMCPTAESTRRRGDQRGGRA